MVSAIITSVLSGYQCFSVVSSSSQWLTSSGSQWLILSVCHFFQWLFVGLSCFYQWLTCREFPMVTSGSKWLSVFLMVTKVSRWLPVVLDGYHGMVLSVSHFFIGCLWFCHENCGLG